MENKNLLIQTVTYMTEIGQKTKELEMEYYILKIKISMKDNGKMMNLMV